MKKRLIVVSLGCIVLLGMGDGNLYSRSMWSSMKFSWHKWRNSYPYHNEVGFFKTLDQNELAMIPNDIATGLKELKEAELRFEMLAKSGADTSEVAVEGESLRNQERLLQERIEKEYDQKSFWSLYQVHAQKPKSVSEDKTK